MTLTREKILEELRNRADHFRAQGIVSMSLFGSFARGDATEMSDVDILVTLPATEASGLACFGMLRKCRAELETVFDRAVDVVPASQTKSKISLAIERDRVLAY